MPGPGVKKLLETVRSFGRYSSRSWYEYLSEMYEPSPVEDVPRGHLPVYVGDRKQRFVIEVRILNHHLLETLLHISEEEFGYQQTGGLRFACEPDFFQYVLELIITKNPTADTCQLSDLISQFNSEER